MDSFSLPQIQAALKRLIPALTGLIVFIVFAYANASVIDTWLQKFHWVPFVTLSIAALISLQFGRSRLFLCCLGLGIALSADRVETADFELVLSTAGICVSWLLWRPDKGLQPINLLLTLLEVTVVALISWFLLIEMAELLAPHISNLYSTLHSLGPEFSQYLSPFQLILFSLLLVLGVTRILLLPSNNHIALFLVLVAIIMILAAASSFLTQLATLGLSVLFVIATLIDSFNMAFRDELTGIPSRRALMQFVQTLGRKYVVVMGDIDHFKKFNDTYGHDVGDQVLKLVASKLNQVTGGGRAFRYGGEEFTLVFPRKNPEDVLPHVEAIRQLIASYPIVLRSNDRPKTPPKKRQKGKTSVKTKTVNVTCSFGLAERTTEHSQFEKILKQADVALYAAKKAGRNCVKSAKK